MQIYTPRGAISPDGPGTPPSGGIGEAFKLRASSPATMTLAVKKGIGFFYDAGTTSDINGIGGLNDLSLWKPAVLNADQPVILPAAPSLPNSRIDILEVRVNRVVTDPTSRDVLNPSTGVFEPNLVNKTLSWDFDGSYGTVAAPANSTAALSLKTGVPAASPSVPGTTPGYFKLAEIQVGGGVTSVDDSKIVHWRPMLHPAGMCQIAARIRTPQPGFLSLILDSLNAPPGVIASAVWTAYNPLTSIIGDLYIISGVPTGIPIVYLSSGLGLLTMPAIVTIDAPMQAALGGVNASPPVKVAIGQLAVKISLFFMYPGASDGFAHALVSLNG
jgi:hypothetical protein